MEVPELIYTQVHVGRKFYSRYPDMLRVKGKTGYRGIVSHVQDNFTRKAQRELDWLPCFTIIKAGYNWDEK